MKVPQPHLRTGTAAACLLLALAPAGVAQKKSDAEIQREIEFARGLAADWGFVDLADEVVTAVESGGVSSRLKEELGLVKCDVYAIGAKNERDTLRRNELFELALGAYTTFIEENPLSESRPQAEAAFVDVSNNFARALTLAQEEAVGEEAETLRVRQVDVLTAAVSRTGELISGLKSIPPGDRTEAHKREFFTLMLNRGQMLLEMGRTQEEGAYSFEQSLATLEDLVFEAGEGTAFALRAFVVMGDNYAAQQEWGMASDFYMAVVDQAIPRDFEVWRELVQGEGLDEAAKEYRWLFVQLGTRGLVEAYATQGEMGEGVAWGLHLYNTQRREGFNFAPIGYLSLLEVARTLVDAGGWIGGSTTAGDLEWFLTQAEAEDAHSRRNRRASIELALSIAKEVLDSNRGNNLQVRAQKLISDITNRPGIVVPPAQLFDAAQGEFYEKNYGGAIAGFKRVLGALEKEDQALRNEFGPKTLFFLGDCYRRLNRPMEAAIAFKEGATTWLGDPEYDARNAQGYYKSTIELRNRMGDDDLIKELVAESEQIALSVGTDNENAIRYKNAEKARRNKQWDEAIQLYEQIPITENDGEKARVYAGVCKFRKGDVAGALAVFEEYLGQYVPDPKNVLKSETRKQRRSEAMALAEFYRSLIRFKGAERSGVAEDWRKTLEGLDDYYLRYPGQDVLGPWTMQIAVDAYLALGELEKAKALYGEMVDRFPDNKFTGSVALTFYSELKAQLDAATTPEERQRLDRECAELLKRGNDVAPKPAFGNLRQESKHWMVCGEYGEAERVLRRLITKFEDDPEQEEALNRYARPDLGEALLAEMKVAEALSMLAPLVAEGAAPRPSKDTLLNYCRAVAGWVVEDENGAQRIVAGAAEAVEEYQQASDVLNGVANSSNVDKYACEWYALKFQLIFNYYQWSKLDSRKLDNAKQQFGVLETELTTSFGGVDESCDEHPELAVALGGDVLRKRYLWLGNLLK